MDFRTDIKPISYFKSHAAEMLEHINTTHSTMVITQNGEARGVLMDPATYHQMRQTLGLLKLIAQGEKEIEAGQFIPQKDVFAQIRKKLKK